jgi:prepilin-type N-terminal cleavage/methylation domain-containing protein
MTRARISSRTMGFTLIELLAAMLAGALLLVWLGWATRAIGEEWQRSQIADPVDELAATLPMLRRFVENAIPEDKANVAPAGEVSFLAFAPDALAGEPIVRMTLSVETAPDATRRLVARAADAKSGLAIAPPALLANGWHDIGLRTEAGDAGSTPQIAITFVDARQQSYPLHLRMRPPVAAACRFDPISLTCRP